MSPANCTALATILTKCSTHYMISSLILQELLPLKANLDPLLLTPTLSNAFIAISDVNSMYTNIKTKHALCKIFANLYRHKGTTFHHYNINTKITAIKLVFCNEVIKWATPVGNKFQVSAWELHLGHPGSLFSYVADNCQVTE